MNADRLLFRIDANYKLHSIHKTDIEAMTVICSVNIKYQSAIKQLIKNKM